MQHFANTPEDTKKNLPKRDVFPAMLKGFKCKCPNCGDGKLFNSYLKVRDTCDICSEELFHQRADDAPAYFTIAIVSKIVTSLYIWVEIAYQPDYWIHAVLWLPMILIMCLGLLPLTKGALIGLQWANYMHGFNPNHVEGDDIELPHEDILAKQASS